jgi:dTDP-glucose 4,6-dehydratase
MAIYHPKSILVTGGAGFIGANFIRYLLQEDASVNITNLDSLTYAGSLENLKNLPAPQRYQFIHGDICDGQLVAKLLRQYSIDTIVHFAAESHVDRSIAGPAAFIQTNIIGTFTLLNEAHNYWLQEQKLTAQQCRFHHISTDEVYGTLKPTDPPFTESHRYEPNSPYSASKASSDHLVHAYCQTYGLPVVITNCSNNYGPYQHPEKFIPTIIQSCLQQKPIPIYGNGSNIRDWLYVEDHCSGIWMVIQKGRLGETYNIGGGNEWANIEVVKLICKLMDKHYSHNAPHEKLITFIADRLGHDWRYGINANKIHSELGWEPQQSFIQGLTKTIKFYTHIEQNTSLLGESVVE